MSSKANRILAFSDLHGQGHLEAALLVEKKAPDWIVLLGDMLPDFIELQDFERRLEAQRVHWTQHQSAFMRLGVPTTFVLGNHEMEGFDPEWREMPQELRGQVGIIQGIPIENGAWGFSREWEEPQLREELNAQGFPRILLSHCPPLGVLDRTRAGEHIGHRPLCRRIQDLDHAPDLILCGHIHEAFGWERAGETLVVNAATGWAEVQWNPDGYPSELLGMGRIAGS